MGKASDGGLSLTPFVEDSIWIQEYPVHYAGCSLRARMSVVRLASGKLLLHSPCNIDEQTKREIDRLGEVGVIIAPGNYHYLHVASAQAAYPQAETFICPGIEEKLPNLKYNDLLGDQPEPGWQEDFEQVRLHGSRFMQEVAFFHKPSQTLLLVDLIENITDDTPDTNLILKIWWKVVFRMWNHPKPAPEYQLGWKDKKAARQSLEKIMHWDFRRIILAHGDLILSDAKQIARRAWQVPLGNKG